MDRASFFIRDRALFGSFPTQEAVNELEENGVRFFINLTHNYESKITSYTTNFEYINYPIEDRSVPSDQIDFARFIVKLATLLYSLNRGEYIYIHCKGGHGRSGVVVACLLAYVFSYSPKQAIWHTTSTHSKRKEMREKWRQLGSPQTKAQKSFIYRFFEDARIYPFYPNGQWSILSDMSKFPIKTELGEFETISDAYEEHISSDPSLDKLRLMETLLRIKCDTYPEVSKRLYQTGLRKIIYHSHNSLWGNGTGYSGSNNFGKILMKIRQEYFDK